MESIDTLNPPPPWRLDAEQRPTEETSFLQAIQFLNEHQAWVNSHFEMAKHYFELLDETNFETSTCTEQAVTIATKLYEQYPDFFPKKIKLRMGDQERDIPKATLMKRSQYFARMVGSGMREAQQRQIEFNVPQGHEGSVSSFLNYLVTGQVELSGDNVMPLLFFAHAHDVQNLLISCLDFLTRNLTKETFPEVLETALLHNVPDLQSACIEFASTRENSESFYPLFQSIWSREESSEAEIKIFLWAEQCFSKKIRLFRDETGVGIELNGLTILDPESFKALGEMQQALGFQSIRIRNRRMNDDTTALLANELPRIESLKIDNVAGITCIPEPWKESLKTIVLKDCKVEKLSLLHAQRVTIFRCPSLSEISAETAKEVDCSYCRELGKVSFSMAERVRLAFCPNLLDLNLISARKIDVDSCRDLKNLIAWRALEIRCNCCHKMTTVEAGRARKIDLEICTSLTKLVASNALEVRCFCGHALTKLELPMAERIDLSFCIVLETLIAPHVKSLVYEGLRKLTEADVPEEIRAELKANRLLAE